MIIVSRRELMRSAAGAALLGTVSPLASLAAGTAAAEPKPTLLRAIGRTIEVNGKPANRFRIVQRDGTWGFFPQIGRFYVRLQNDINAPTLVHWHGLTPPYGQDGVPNLPQPLLPPGKSYDYDFPLNTPGTHWMHAHTLQEQQGLAAPLIVTDPREARRDEQEVVVLFEDFSWRSPEEILAGLRQGARQRASADKEMAKGHGMAEGAMAGMSGNGMTMPGMQADLNDVDYDAYLANDRTLGDPVVFRVEPGGMVRLRLINGGTATAFWIDMGALTGEVIAADGNPVMPVTGHRFPLVEGQTIDIRIKLPKSEGAWPVLALREGAKERTGFVLATKSGAVRHIESIGTHASGPLDLSFEARLAAADPLAEKNADRRETVILGGDMARYLWTLDGKAWPEHKSIEVRAGERVELTMRNDSMMSHPMHLHGHHFRVVAIDGRRFEGAMRDTVLVPPKRDVTIAFDTNNPGTWAFHCHQLYHMAAGMFTTVVYSA